MAALTKTELLSTILELENGINKIESVLKENPNGEIFTLNWKDEGAIYLSVGKETVSMFNNEKMKLAKKWLKLIKARKLVLENELKLCL